MKQNRVTRVKLPRPYQKRSVKLLETKLLNDNRPKDICSPRLATRVPFVNCQIMYRRLRPPLVRRLASWLKLGFDSRAV